jgi:hypothetical protein
LWLLDWHFVLLFLVVQVVVLVVVVVLLMSDGFTSLITFLTGVSGNFGIILSLALK